MQGEVALAPRAIEIAPGAWQVGGPELTAPEDAAIYVVDGGSRAAIIDVGCGAGSTRCAPTSERPACLRTASTRCC